MRVDLSIVPMLDTEGEINPPALQNILINTKIPCRHLEAMKDVIWDLILWYTFMHDIFEVSHFPVTITVLLHKAFLEKHLFVEEMFLPGDFLEALWDFIVTITNEADEEVILAKIVFLINLHRVVVMQKTRKSVPQFILVLVVHGDTHSDAWIPLPDIASCLDL